MTFRDRGRVTRQADAPAVAAGYANLYAKDRSPDLYEKAAYMRGGGGTGTQNGLRNGSANQLNRRYDEYEQYDHQTQEVYENPPQLKLNAGAGPRIPKIERGDSADDEEEEDGLISPRRITQQIGAFSAMASAGADWGSALVSALQGHKMTEEQAAICLQSHWRRHEAVVSRIARGLAAEHIQNVWREHQELRDYQYEQRQRMIHERAQRHAEQDWASTAISSAYRGHLSRVYARELRGKAKKSVLRSFSFSKKRAAKKAPEPPKKELNMTPAAAEPDDGYGTPSTPRGGGGAASAASGLAKRVRRSLSFDKKSHAGGGSSSQLVSLSCTKRTFVLERGPQGLGLELDATNTVVTIKPGGRAERQGLLCLGDTILTIDGKSCAGRLMQDVMVPGRSCYVVEVSRPERSAPTPVKSSNIIRRSLSFDSKKSGGVKRSFSFERKRKGD